MKHEIKNFLLLKEVLKSAYKSYYFCEELQKNTSIDSSKAIQFIYYNSIQNAVIQLCKIFDKSKDKKSTSFLRLITQIKDRKIPSEQSKIINEIERLIEQFRDETDFKEIRNARDKVFAHTERNFQPINSILEIYKYLEEARVLLDTFQKQFSKDEKWFDKNILKIEANLIYKELF